MPEIDCEICGTDMMQEEEFNVCVEGGRERVMRPNIGILKHGDDGFEKKVCRKCWTPQRKVKPKTVGNYKRIGEKGNLQLPEKGW